MFKLGHKNKVVASHAMNMTSSRSHTIFSLSVESVDTNDLESTA